jgi:hypothetical protein
VAADPLQRLARRIRWKRCIGKLHRFAWIVAVGFLLLYGADCLIGLRTLSLRIASAVGLVLAVSLFAADMIASWVVRLDRVGLAQLLEERHPELAERLITLVQIPAEESDAAFTRLLQAETRRQLAELKPDEACSLQCECKAWGVTAVLLASIFIGLAFLPSFGRFSQRFFGAWTTPLVPYEIALTHGNGYALRGGDYAITVTIDLVDEHAELPRECRLIGADDAGAEMEMPMQSTGPGTFTATLGNIQRPLRCRVVAGDAQSESISLGLIDAPVFTAKPGILVVPPEYAQKNIPAVALFFGAGTPKEFEVLRFSKMYYSVGVKGFAGPAKLRVKRLDEPGERVYPVQWKPDGVVEAIAAEAGSYQAEVVLELEHGLSTTLPVGQFTVRDDRAPRFLQSLRLHGSDSGLRANYPYRIAPGAFLKLQAVIADEEGLDAVALEYRVNDEAPVSLERWLVAGGRPQITIDSWLPLPNTLQEGDRVQFRLRVSDNRRLKKGAIVTGDDVLPAQELMPHVVFAPAAATGSEAWIEFRVERFAEDWLKQYAEAQADELKDIIVKIKQKVQSEADQAQQLQRTIHQQAVLTPLQIQQAEKLQGLDLEIAEDLLRAGKKFAANPELARLAEHFFDIADTEMRKSAAALKQFRDRGRTLAEAEQDLQTTQDALKEASKKLDRMLGWNKMLAQDRLDRWQLEKLAKRQEELADRLAKMLAELPLSDADRAKEIEAIRQEQARLAEQTEKLQEQSRLVQESTKAAEQMRVERLAKEAEQLAAEQRVMREQPPEKMPAEIKVWLDKLAQRQADLAERAVPFAMKNQGPDAKPAQQAADALKKPHLGEALEQQKEHETRLHDWLGKLLPGIKVNALREQVVQLAKKQKDIRGDLERLGRDLPNLDEKTLQAKLRELVNRQKELHAAVAKLPVDPKDERLRGPHQGAQKFAEQAADQLAGKDALQSFESMEKAHQQLQALANLLPDTLPADRKAIKDPAARERIEQIEKFAAEQKQLREETERLLADLMKASAGHGAGALKEKADKLAADLLELAQKGGPEAKGMAKEAAEAVDNAKKAMAASDAMKAKGDVEEAKKLDEDAAKQLDIAVKQLAKLTQDQAAKDMPKADAEKTAEALKQSSAQMRQAEENLPKLPRDAQVAMKSAAQNLNDAAQQASKQSARNLPKPMRDPAAKSSSQPGGPSSALAHIDKLNGLDGKAWGELPGELKTQMLQDFRARYGAEYAEVIRQYFERLAQTPRKE